MSKGRGKKGVNYIAQEEPAFLKQFKQKVGYKEGPTIDTKREIRGPPDFDDDDDRPEEEDEKPVVVVLKKGDLTEEEAEKMGDGETWKDADESGTDGKIIFKKPKKRTLGSSGDTSDLQCNTSKKTKDIEKTEQIDKVISKKKQQKGVKNISLLSFNEEEDEDG